MTKTIHHLQQRAIEALLETDEEEPLATQMKKRNKKRKIRIRINLDKWIPDELHLILRVKDVY